MKLPSHFALNTRDYDTMVRVEVHGDYREEVLESLGFDLNGWKVYGLCPDHNIETLSRVFLLKKLDEDEENGNDTRR